MSAFVIGGDLLFFVAQDEAAAFLAHEDLVLGVFKVGHVQAVLVELGGLKRGFVHEVFKVGAGEAGRALGNGGEVHVLGEGGAAGVDFENAFAAAQIRRGNHDLTVETAGTQQRGIQHVGAVCGRNENDAFVGFKAVHFHEQLVEGLLAFVVTAAETCAALTTHGVDFVDEDEAGGVLLALSEEVAHARSAHAHEHFHEVGTGNGEERHTGFTGHGAGQQGLAGSGRAYEQHALGNAAAKARKLARIGKKFHNFGKFFLGFVNACHIGERDLAHLILILHARAGTAERHGLSAAALHLTGKEDPHADEQQHGEPRNEHRHGKRRFFGLLDVDDHVLVLEFLNEVRIVGGIGAVGAAVVGDDGDVSVFDHHLTDFPVVDLREESTVGGGVLRGSAVFVEQAEQGDHGNGYDAPQQDIAGKLVQSCLHGCL